MTSRRIDWIITIVASAAVGVAMAGNLASLRRDVRGGWLFSPYDMFSHPVGDSVGSQLRLRVSLADGREIYDDRVYPILPVEHFRVASMVKEVLTFGDVRSAESLFRMVVESWGKRRVPINQVWRFPRRLRGEIVMLEIVVGSVRLFGIDSGNFTQQQTCLRYIAKGDSRDES